MASLSIIAKDVRFVNQVICIKASAASTNVEDMVLQVALVCADEGHDIQGVCILDSATVPVSFSRPAKQKIKSVNTALVFSIRLRYLLGRIRPC
jgi:hypothetical protein